MIELNCIALHCIEMELTNRNVVLCPALRSDGGHLAFICTHKECTCAIQISNPVLSYHILRQEGGLECSFAILQSYELHR